MRARGARKPFIVSLAAVAAVSLAPAALAQAWLPSKGSVGVSLDHTYTLNKKHFTSTGDEIDAGHTQTHVLVAGMSWSPADRVMFKIGLPLVQTKYDGDFPHPGEIDNGRTHRKVTDFQASFHYQLVDGPFALAPFMGLNIPVQDYTTLGHASPGRGLNEFTVGFFAAQSLHEWIPRSYVQMRYSYAFVEEVAGVSHDRSNVDLEVGYFLSPDWSLRLLGSWQDTYGGVQIPIPPSNPLFPFHDQLAEDDHLDAGGGIAWQVTDRIAVHTLYMHGLKGQNSHKVDTRIALGFSYELGGH